MSILSQTESNSLYYILRFFRLFLSFGGNNSNLMHQGLTQLLSKIENNPEPHIDWRLLGEILIIDELQRMLFYFLDHKAATSFIIQMRLDIPEATTYRFLKRLEKVGIVRKAMKMPRQRGAKGGPRPTIYEVPDATINEVTEAAKTHKRLMSPKYQMGEKVGQLILDEYLEPLELKEISYKDILNIVKRKKILYIVPDVADIAAQYLHLQGIKVWR